jgi:hypothetical protein
MNHTWLRIGLVVVAATVSGCGDGAGGDDGGSGGTGGTAATGGGSPGGSGGRGEATGGTGGEGPSSGGSSSGGTNDSGAAGASPVGAHCSPGEFYEGVFAYKDGGGPMSNCHNGYDFSQFEPGSDLSLRDIELETPLLPGQKMAFSIGFSVGGPPLEFWGSTEECGPALEQLAAVDAIVEGITCVELSGTAAYSHVLMLWRGGGMQDSATICPTGTCPP